MTLERMIRAIAGTFVLASVALGYWVSPWFLAFTAFVGANLLQSSVTRWCLMEQILRKFGVKGECDDRRAAERAHRAGSSAVG